MCVGFLCAAMCVSCERKDGAQSVTPVSEQTLKLLGEYEFRTKAFPRSPPMATVCGAENGVKIAQTLAKRQHISFARARVFNELFRREAFAWLRSHLCDKCHQLRSKFWGRLWKKHEQLVYKMMQERQKLWKIVKCKSIDHIYGSPFYRAHPFVPLLLLCVLKFVQWEVWTVWEIASPFFMAIVKKREKLVCYVIYLPEEIAHRDEIKEKPPFQLWRIEMAEIQRKSVIKTGRQ